MTADRRRTVLGKLRKPMLGFRGFLKEIRNIASHWNIIIKLLHSPRTTTNWSLSIPCPSGSSALPIPPIRLVDESECGSDKDPSRISSQLLTMEEAPPARIKLGLMAPVGSAEQVGWFDLWFKHFGWWWRIRFGDSVKMSPSCKRPSSCWRNWRWYLNQDDSKPYCYRFDHTTQLFRDLCISIYIQNHKNNLNIEQKIYSYIESIVYRWKASCVALHAGISKDITICTAQQLHKNIKNNM